MTQSSGRLLMTFSRRVICAYDIRKNNNLSDYVRMHIRKIDNLSDCMKDIVDNYLLSNIVKHSTKCLRNKQLLMK